MRENGLSEEERLRVANIALNKLIHDVTYGRSRQYIRAQDLAHIRTLRTLAVNGEVTFFYVDGTPITDPSCDEIHGFPFENLVAAREHRRKLGVEETLINAAMRVREECKL